MHSILSVRVSVHRYRPYFRILATWFKNACALIGLVYILQLMTSLPLNYLSSKDSGYHSNLNSRHLKGVEPRPLTRPHGNTSVTKVIVLAYYRGGSSFLAQLLNHHPDVVYLFEPLTSPFYEYKTEQRMHGTGDVYVHPQTGEYR